MWLGSTGRSRWSCDALNYYFMKSTSMWWECQKLKAYLQGRENKKHGEINLDHQVRELISKHLSDQTAELVINKNYENFFISSSLEYLMTRRSKVGMYMVRMLLIRGLPRTTSKTNWVPFDSEQKRIWSIEYSVNSSLLPLNLILSGFNLTKSR